MDKAFLLFYLRWSQFNIIWYNLYQVQMVGFGSGLIHWGTSELDLSLAGVSDAWRVRGETAADLPYLTHLDPSWRRSLCWELGPQIVWIPYLQSLKLDKFGVFFRSPKFSKTFRWQKPAVRVCCLRSCNQGLHLAEPVLLSARSSLSKYLELEKPSDF